MTAIKIENLSKKYVIKHQKKTGTYTTLRDSFIDNGKKLFQQIVNFVTRKKLQKTTHEEFFALDEINLTIKQGAKVGIIGRNGAGKSTLLKVLSRITEPTSGKISFNGRIASLLEVGTGFHPELTGRENIYLNGTVLGMTHKEINAKFDEIVDFAGVEKFLDTPVKRYSSGMYVRLAFSVAAHLEPEILVVDEVLAVGDANFQKKCMGKMGEISKQGRTIIFVSHNMNAIEKLCDHAILLDKGRVVSQSDNVHEVIQTYLALNESGDGAAEWKNYHNSFKDLHFSLTRFAVEDHDNAVLKRPMSNTDTVKVVVEGNVEVLDKALQVGYALYDEQNNLLYWSLFNDVAEDDWLKLEVGKNKLISNIPKRFLNQGTYRLELIIAMYYQYWIIEPDKNSPSVYFTIQGGLSDSPYWMVKRPGVLAPVIEWHKG
jgi:lipopolysaccharide transport system ATP-binding protein